ncbi:hypothetical protein [Streptomyces zaomyceticus]|uniref:hypothetical protein n=1 Tax=Streptomyces zaomyceticus TaxID=68286 RepID=UPI0037BDA6F9
MTDTSTEPVTVPAPAPPITQPAVSPAGLMAVKESPVVEHTAGGWPVVPLATTSANSAVGGLAAAALAGGPAGIATAVAGVAVLGGAVLARRAVRNRTAKTTTRAGTKSKTMPTPRATRQNTSGTRNASSTPATGTKRGSSGSPSPSGKPILNKGRSAGSTAAGASPARESRPTGRVGQVKALRQAAQSSAPTRADRRTQTTQARRQAADTRRNTPSPRHSGSSGATSSRRSSSGLAGRGGSSSKGRGSGAGLGGRVRAGRDAAVQRARAARDRQAAKAVDASRGKVRAAATAKQARTAKRAVRKEARRQLWRSALRKQARRLAAALLAAPVGAIGMLTTPLGRKLGIAALQHPGRRLYRRLMRTAEEQRAVRDAAIRERREAAEAVIDAELSQDVPQIGGTAERPFRLIPASPSSPVEVVNVSGFKFEEAAAEMENAARTYEPEGAMEILAMVENLPDALTSVANTFRILAERSDSEFPLEKDIAGAFDEIYGALMRAVDSSGDLGPLFQQVHEHDIARHTDPRNGPEAEKGWNV